MLQIISERIQLAYTSIDQNQRQTAESLLLELEENDNQLPTYLIQLFEQQSQIKFYILIFLKNVIKRKWNWLYKDQMSNKNKQFYQEEYKKMIRDKLLQLYMIENQNQFKQEIIQIIMEISRTDYPQKYPALLNYFEAEIIKGNYKDEGFLIFLNKIFKIMISNQQKNNQFTQLSEKIGQIWLVTKNDFSNQQYQLLIDKIFLNFILSYQPLVFSEQIEQIFILIMQKAVALINQDQKLYDKNLQFLLKKLCQLFSIHQTQLEKQLSDFINLLIFYTYQNRQPIIKAGLIALIKLFQNQILFLNDQSFEKFLLQKNDQKKQQLLSYRDSSQKIISTLFESQTKSLFEKLLNYLTFANKLSFEDIIEQEEENEFQKLIHPKEAEVFTLALITAEQILEKFPKLCSTLLQEYLNQAISVNFQINPSILESLLIIIGLVPRVQLKVNYQFNIKFDSIFAFLQSSTQINHQRRFAILLKRLIPIFDENQMLFSLQSTGSLLSTTQDYSVRYQSLMCIKEIASRFKGNLQWAQILITTSPFIVDLIQSLTRITNISPLLDLISLLIEKSQISQPEQIGVAIEQSGLLKLVQQKFQLAEQDSLVLEQVCEMLKTIIVAYPYGSQIQHLFQLAFTLIQANILSKQTCILQLILFLLQEYNEQTQNFQVVQLLNIIPQNLNAMLSDSNQTNQSIVIMIIEELYLFQVFKIQDIPKQLNLLQTKYSQKSLNLKNAVLGLTTTMILLMLNNNVNDIDQFSGVILNILQDFLSEQVMENLDTKFRIEVQILSILNRFIIWAKASFFQFLINNQITIQAYVQSWLQKSQLLESDKSRKINIIAFLIATEFMQPEHFLSFFAIISKQYQKLVQKQQQQSKPLNITAASRLFLYRTSSRKDLLRNTQMYNDQEFKDFYNATLQNYVQKHNLQLNYLNS